MASLGSAILPGWSLPTIATSEPAGKTSMASPSPDSRSRTHVSYYGPAHSGGASSSLSYEPACDTLPEAVRQSSVGASGACCQ